MNGLDFIVPLPDHPDSFAEKVRFRFVPPHDAFRIVVGNVYERVFEIADEPFIETRERYEQFLMDTGIFRIDVDRELSTAEADRPLAEVEEEER